ncbi:hypothetical protein NDU88_002584 [Pleurodeles waltl]|uniref:Uncharacterized protein n=1 Tax=Pleurodeles waltl TaxID=8319 RepID=A0AAV7LJ72_PLEWA|nr:hypothetical protein NDU88_002584 [Pleurodeles waltl]
MRSPGGRTQSGLLTGQLRGAPRLRVSPLCIVPQSGGIRLRLPSRRPIRRRQVPPADAPACTSLQGGPAFKASAGRCVPLNPGPRPQPGGEPRGSRPAPGRTSPPEAAPGAAAALKPLRSRRPLTYNAPTREAPNSPSHSGARSRGARPRSPRPQQSSHSALDTGPPTSARPGTDLKSAPPEPIR